LWWRGLYAAGLLHEALPGGGLAVHNRGVAANRVTVPLSLLPNCLQHKTRSNYNKRCCSQRSMAPDLDAIGHRPKLGVAGPPGAGGRGLGLVLPSPPAVITSGSRKGHRGVTL
jgi:hypothetical protein